MNHVEFSTISGVVLILSRITLDCLPGRVSRPLLSLTGVNSVLDVNIGRCLAVSGLFLFTAFD